MRIEYYIKNVYGNDHMYIVDPEQAHAVGTLTKKKTIDHNDIKALERLGHTLERVHAPID